MLPGAIISSVDNVVSINNVDSVNNVDNIGSAFAKMPPRLVQTNLTQITSGTSNFIFDGMRAFPDYERGPRKKNFFAFFIFVSGRTWVPFCLTAKKIASVFMSEVKKDFSSPNTTNINPVQSQLRCY